MARARTIAELKQEVRRAADVVERALPITNDTGGHILNLREIAFGQVLAELLDNEYES